MEKNVMQLLEEKRLVLGESIEKFAKNFGISKARYLVVRSKGKGGKLPDKWIPKAAQLLGISEEDIRNQIPNSRIRKQQNADELGFEDLEYLASIAKAAGHSLPIKMLIELVEIKKKHS